jgi:hypothetical protein
VFGGMRGRSTARQCVCKTPGHWTSMISIHPVLPSR